MFSENLNNESLAKIVSIFPFCFDVKQQKNLSDTSFLLNLALCGIKCPPLLKSELPAFTSWRKTKKRRRREDGPPWQLKRRGGAAERTTTGPDTQLRAVNLVTQEAKSVAADALACGVPRATLLDKLNGKHKTEMVGRPCVLSKIKEKVLVEILVLMGKYNYSLTRRHLADMVKDYLDKRKIVSRLKNIRPEKA